MNKLLLVLLFIGSLSFAAKKKKIITPAPVVKSKKAPPVKKAGQPDFLIDAYARMPKPNKKK